jgi:hypothetical protein
MTNIAKLAYGSTGSTWTTGGFTASDFNSRANGSVVVAATAIDQDTSLDLDGEFSFSVEVGGTTTATSRLDLYILPLNQDGTTYGDGVATGTTAPAGSYWVASCIVRPGVTSGNAVVGTFPRYPLPGADFKYAIVNNLGAALDSTATWTGSHRTLTRNLNG